MFTTVQAQAHQLQELTKKLPGRDVPSYTHELTQCLRQYVQLAADALPSCETQQDLWNIYPRSFPASLAAVWDWLHAWVDSGQPHQSVLEAIGGVTACLRSSTDLYIDLAKAHTAKKPPANEANTAAGKKADTLLDALVLRRGLNDTILIVLADLCHNLHCLPRAAAGRPPLHGCDVPAEARRWDLFEPLLQVAMNFCACALDHMFFGLFHSTTAVDALINLINLTYAYTERLITPPLANTNAYYNCLGRLGPQGQVVGIEQTVPNILFQAYTRIMDMLVVKLNDGGLRPAEVHLPDGTRLGDAAAARLEARIMASLIKVLRVLLLSHLTWQNTSDDGPGKSIHISFFRADMQCLKLLCSRQPWPRPGLSQQQQQQEVHQLPAGEAQQLLQALQDTAWSVLRLSRSRHNGTPAPAHSGDFDLAQFYAASLLTHIQGQQQLVPHWPGCLLGFDVLSKAFAELHADQEPRTLHAIQCKAKATRGLLPLLTTEAIGVVQQLQRLQQQHAGSTTMGKTGSDVVPPGMMDMLSRIQQAFNRLSQNDCCPLDLCHTVGILAALRKATTSLLLTDHAGTTAAAAAAGHAAGDGHGHQYAAACDMVASNSLWSQSPGLYRAAALHLLPAFCITGERSLFALTEEYQAARIAEARKAADGLAAGHAQDTRAVREVLALLEDAMTAALAGVINVCWPALPGTAAIAAELRSSPSGLCGVQKLRHSQRQQQRQQKRRSEAQPTRLPGDSQSLSSGSSPDRSPCYRKGMDAYNALLYLAASGILSTGSKDAFALLTCLTQAIRGVLPAALELLHPEPAPAVSRVPSEKKDKQEQDRREAAWQELQLLHQATAALTVIRLLQLAAQCIELVVKLASEASTQCADELTGIVSGCNGELGRCYYECAERMRLSSSWISLAIATQGILPLLVSEDVVSLMHYPWRQQEQHPPEWQRHPRVQEVLQQLGDAAQPDLLPRVLASITHSICSSVSVTGQAMACHGRCRGVADGPLQQLQAQQGRQQLGEGRQQGIRAAATTDVDAAGATAAPQSSRRTKIVVIHEDSDDEDPDEEDPDEIAASGASCRLQPLRQGADAPVTRAGQGAPPEEPQRCKCGRERMAQEAECMLRDAAHSAEQLVIACAQLAAQQPTVLQSNYSQQRTAAVADGRGATGGAVQATPDATPVDGREDDTLGQYAEQAQLVVAYAQRTAGLGWRATALLGADRKTGADGKAGPGSKAVSQSGSDGGDRIWSGLDRLWFGGDRDTAEHVGPSHLEQPCRHDWQEVAISTYAELSCKAFQGCGNRHCPRVVPAAAAERAACLRCQRTFCCKACMDFSIMTHQHACAHDYHDWIQAPGSEGSAGSNSYDVASSGLDVEEQDGAQVLSAGPEQTDLLQVQALCKSLNTFQHLQALAAAGLDDQLAQQLQLRREELLAELDKYCQQDPSNGQKVHEAYRTYHASMEQHHS